MGSTEFPGACIHSTTSDNYFTSWRRSDDSVLELDATSSGSSSASHPYHSEYPKPSPVWPLPRSPVVKIAPSPRTTGAGLPFLLPRRGPDSPLGSLSRGRSAIAGVPPAAKIAPAPGSVKLPPNQRLQQHAGRPACLAVLRGSSSCHSVREGLVGGRLNGGVRPLRSGNPLLQS